MKLFRKIDTQTGNFIEDVLFESHPFLTETVTEEITLEDGATETIETVVNVLDEEGQPIPDPQYIEEAPAQGFYLPRWNGSEWVEGGQAPEPTIPESTTDDLLMMAIADLDAQREQDKLEQQLAMAELAETMIGGMA